MSIQLKELLKDYDFSKQSKEVQDNLLTLLERLSKIRSSYGKPMTVTSGLRTKEDQIRIYKAKGITDLSKIPMGSKHLVGAAADILDLRQELQQWCIKNEKMLADVGLWCEKFDYTKTWVHFQCYPPKSGARFFIP